VDGLGEKWTMLGVILKAFPCHISFHAVIEGIQAFRREHQYQPEDITRVRVSGAARMMEDRFSDRAPTTLMGAQYSLPWSAAFALCEDVSDPQTWLNANLSDPRIARIAALMELHGDSDRFGKPGGPVAEVSLTIAGSEHSFPVTDWKGAPTNPYSWNDIARKFARYASPVLQPSRVREIIERVSNLESEPDVSALADLVAVLD
jgi:2-methylcitrate dehydratase PrpD